MAAPAENDQALCELIENEAELFGSGATNSNSRELREHPRFPFRGRAQCVVFSPEGEEEPQEAEVLTTDLSRTGMSLLYRRPLKPGQQILLMLNETNRLVEVCWCCRVWSGLYAAGCRFIGVPRTEPLEA